MKKLIPAIALLLLCSTPSFAWNCPSGQHRVQAPPGTPTTTPYYDVVEGIAFICEPDQPVAPANPGQQQNQNQSSTNNNSNTNNNSSKSTSRSNSNSSSNSSSASNSTSSSGVTNSGNSSSTASNDSSGNVTSFSENVQRNTPMAFAPDAAFTTSPCVKGFSAGLSFPGGAGTGGFSKTDKGCDSRQTAVVFHGIGNDTAAAKILCSTDAAKRANLTLADCTAIVRPPAPVLIRENPAPVAAPQPTVIIVPQPVSVPAAAPAPVAVERKPALTPRSTRVCLTSVKVAYIGSCTVGSSACLPILDKAVGLVAGKNNSRIVLTGPVDSGKVVSYLRKRIDASRITIKLADEQNSTLTVQTETGE